jgi:hypothetical protein
MSQGPPYRERRMPIPIGRRTRFLKDNRERIKVSITKIDRALHLVNRPVFLPFFSLIFMAWVTVALGIEVQVPAISARSSQFLLATPVKCFAMIGVNFTGQAGLKMRYLNDR